MQQFLEYSRLQSLSVFSIDLGLSFQTPELLYLWIVQRCLYVIRKQCTIILYFSHCLSFLPSLCCCSRPFLLTYTWNLFKILLHIKTLPNCRYVILLRTVVNFWNTFLLFRTIEGHQSASNKVWMSAGYSVAIFSVPLLFWSVLGTNRWMPGKGGWSVWFTFTLI